MKVFCASILHVVTFTAVSKGAVVGEGKRGILQSRSGIGIFGVAVLAIFRSVFRFLCQNLRFFGLAVNFGLRILRVLAFGFWFSSNTNRSVGIFFRFVFDLRGLTGLMLFNVSCNHP